jgi:hypothetical protein
MLLLLYPQGGTASGETFAQVELYISGDVDPEDDIEGELKVDEPSTSSSKSVVIGDGEQSAGNIQEVGRWTTSSLYASANISGDWSGKAWISTNRDATVTLTYTLIQNDENLDSFQFEGEVGSGETVAIGGESDFSLTGIDDSPLTLLIESTWTAQPGSTPPPPPENTTIILEYGANSRDTYVKIPISHVQISEGNLPNPNEGQSQIMIYLHVFDVFGVDEILSMVKDDYNMRMGPVGGESPWSSSVDKVTDRGDYVEVQFLWSYEGHTLPAGENEYTIEAGVTDYLSDIEWSENLRTIIFIEPRPDVEIDIVSSASKTAEFGKSAIYTLSIQNTGSGDDEFIVTYDNNDEAQGWTIELDLYEFELVAGDSENVKVTVTPPNTASDGQESPTQITVTAASDSDIHDSVTLLTISKEPEPDWDFSIGVSKDGNENYDFACGCFVINDRAEIEITIILTNEGNQQNNYNIKAISDESPDAFSLEFNPSFISSLPPGQSINLILTLKPRDDYSGQSTYVVVEATSSGDGRKEESEPLSIILEQSGNVFISISSPLKAPQGGTISHSFQISNTNMEEAKRIYFVVSGITNNDKLAEGWINFEDKDSKQITYGSFLTLLPSQSVEMTLRISIPPDADIGSYNLKIWMANDQNLRISDQSDLGFVATQATVTEESDFPLYGVLILILGGVLVYGYRNFSSDDGFEDEYDDDFPDELEDIPELIQTPSIPEVKPVKAPLPAAAEIPSPSVAAVVSQPEVAVPVSKPRKKWFGLFSRSEPEVSVPLPELHNEIPVAVAQPIVAEPMVAQPIVAEPMMAQPIVAEPMVAQPIVAEPMVAQPIVAEPVVAQPIVAEPVVAQPIVAEPVVAQPIMAEPVVAQPIMAEPVVAQPIVAEPVVAQPIVAEPVVAQPIEEDEE